MRPKADQARRERVGGRDKTPPNSALQNPANPGLPEPASTVLKDTSENHGASYRLPNSLQIATFTSKPWRGRLVRRVIHHHHHHRGGGDGQWILWLIGAAVAVLLLRVLLWLAVVAIAAWLIYILRRPLLFALVLIWKAVAFIGRGIGRLFIRRPPAPKLITQAETLPSD